MKFFLILVVSLFAYSIAEEPFLEGDDTTTEDDDLLPREDRDMSFSNLNDNGIVTVNNGVATVMNASGIFVFPVNLTEEAKKPKEEKPKRDIFTGFGNAFTSLNSNGIFTSNGNGIFNSVTPNGTINVINGVITVTNSSGVFMGTSIDNLKKVDSGIGSINVPSGTSVSITNGVITLTNSSGTYVGRSMDSLMKI